MTLTRRQVIALMLGAAAGPAIAAPRIVREVYDPYSLPWIGETLQTGDVISFARGLAGEWRVVKLFPPGHRWFVRLEPAD